jgi:D-alanyl-D-alanine carboxypeptidase
LIDASTGLESSFPPGTGFGYSNTNYVLLGRIIEEVTGDSLQVNLRTRLFTPQGLQNSYLAGAEPISQEWGPGYAMEYAELFGVTDGVFVLDEQMSTLIASTAWAAGAIVATAGDVVQFQQALAHDEYLRSATLAQMRAPSPVADGFLAELGVTGYGVGFGIFVHPFADPIGPGIGHAGGEPGYHSLMMTFPDHDISVAILVNDGSPDFAVIPRGRDYDALLTKLVLEALGD